MWRILKISSQYPCRANPKIDRVPRRSTPLRFIGRAYRTLLLGRCGGTNGFNRLASDALVGRPVAAADADAADALAFDDDRAAALHGRPALRTRREREAERVGDVERLALRAVRGRRPL